MSGMLVKMKTFPTGCSITKAKSYHPFKGEDHMMKYLGSKFKFGELSFSMSAMGSYAMWLGFGNKREYIGRVIILKEKSSGMPEKDSYANF